jgi:hypothetical protein
MHPQITLQLDSQNNKMYMYFKLGIAFILLVLSYSLFAQNKSLLKGKITDQTTTEPLIGATIYLDEEKTGTYTNEQGEFRIQVSESTTRFRVTYIGFLDTTIQITNRNLKLYRIALTPTVKSLDQVKIVASKDDPKIKVNEVQMGVDRVTMAEAKLLPAILGEVDILKVLQLKPGVKSGGEGTAGFFVRGGSNDQNLILVEHAPVYNPSHLFGFFSVFNSDAISNVTLYKSGFPAQYAGRLSSVLDVEMRKGQADSLEIQGGIGLLASRLTLNVPIIKRKLSLLVSGRRTYADVITNSINRLNKHTQNYTPIPSYYFYDFNLAMDYTINNNNRLSLNGYFGNDNFMFSGDNFNANLLWGNRSATLEWLHRFNNRIQVSSAYFTSGYLYRINTGFAELSSSIGSRIWDQGMVNNWNYFINDKHTLKFGASAMYHRFTVGEYGISSVFTDLKGGQNIEAGEFGAYVSHTWKINNRIELLSGLRNSTFTALSKTYNNLEPRLALKTNISSNATIKANYARMYQYIHLVSSSAASLPTDIWYPSMEGISPQASDQISIGYHQAIAQNAYFVSVEGYYKWIYNAIDFRDGAQLFANPELNKEFVFGKGWAYGLEAYIEKKKGKTTGWIGYTLSWSWRQFDKINYGVAFHPRFDRRHDISVVIMHKLNKRLSLSATWVYGTGNFATIAGGRFAFQDILPNQENATPDYVRRNDFQMPSTHRLDIGLVWKLNTKKWDSDITFSLYNAYSRRNPFFVFYAENTNDAGETVSFTPTLVSLFPILPAVTYNFKF